MGSAYFARSLIIVTIIVIVIIRILTSSSTVVVFFGTSALNGFLCLSRRAQIGEAKEQMELSQQATAGDAGVHVESLSSCGDGRTDADEQYFTVK